jgi:hypothetical protein
LNDPESVCDLDCGSRCLKQKWLICILKKLFKRNDLKIQQTSYLFWASSMASPIKTECAYLPAPLIASKRQMKKMSDVCVSVAGLNG